LSSASTAASAGPITGHLWNPSMRNWGYQTYQDKDAYLAALRKKVEALVP